MTKTLSTVPIAGARSLTPKRGSPVKRQLREGNILFTYAAQHQGRVVMNTATKTALAAAGLRPERIPNAVYDLRTYCDLTIVSERNGRQIVAYQIPVNVVE